MPKDLARLVARRFDVLSQLYPNHELHLTQLAENLSVDVGNLSRYVTDLQKKGLIKVHERRIEPVGKPRKYCTLSDKAVAILTPLLQEEEPRTSPPPKWQLDTLIDMLTDTNLSQDFREFSAGQLADLAVWDAALLVTRTRLQTLFQETVSNPPIPNQDKVGKRVMSLLSRSIPQLLANEKTTKWFLDTIFESLRELASALETNEQVRSWAIMNISKVAKLVNDPALRRNVIDKLIAIYFEDVHDLANVVRNELVGFKPEHQKEIIELVQAQMGTPQKRIKAESLLKELFSLWLSPHTRVRAPPEGTFS